MIDFREQRGRIYPVSDWERLNAAAQRTIETGVGFELELQAFRKGATIWVTARAEAVRNPRGEIVGLRGTVQDITDRKRAEQALAERNSQFDLAQKIARVGGYTYDNTLRTMQLSPASAAIYGLSDHVLEISGHEWTARIHPDDAQRLKAERRKAFKTQQRELLGEFRIVRPGGEVRWIESRTLISYNDAGRALRMIGVYIDVTERRRAEDHKNLLISELDHRVKNILACVGVVAQRSRECSKSMDEFFESSRRTPPLPCQYTCSLEPHALAGH